MLIEIPAIGFSLYLSGGFALMFVGLLLMGMDAVYKAGQVTGRKKDNIDKRE